MSETFLNQFTFRIGWKKKESIELFDTEYDIIIKLKAYYEKDGVEISGVCGTERQKVKRKR